MIDKTAERSSIIQDEHEWHDQHAHRRHKLDVLLYRPPAFDGVVESALRFLQGRPGEMVLEVGCGEGKEVVTLASQGLDVVGTDLSQTQLARARDLALIEAPTASVCFVQASAEQLPFADSSFRIVHGKAILHHLDLDIASRETRRLLRPGGLASFSEPLARHPLFRLARWVTPQLRTGNERPLTIGELSSFSKVFSSSQQETYFLLSPFAYALRASPNLEGVFRRAYALLSRIDRTLFRRVPMLRRFAWYGAVRVRK